MGISDSVLISFTVISTTPADITSPALSCASCVALPFTRVNFPHVTGYYALSFSPYVNDYVADSEPYFLWLAPGEQRIYLIAPQPGERRPPRRDAR